MGACGLESGDVALAAIPIRKMTIGIAQTLLLVIEWRIAMPKRTTGDRPELKPVNVGAAAIDIGSRMHMAAVNPACTDMPVRSFGTFTQDLYDLADWFKACGVTNVAMESTGVYWIPVYEILEQRGFDVILVNARYAKNVPGRKTDVSDAAWLRQLHSYGLLRGSFRPDAEIATLRAYLRQRERLVEYAAAHIQHMQKALMEMNLQLHHVVSDITGATGMGLSEPLWQASAIRTCWQPTETCAAIHPTRRSARHWWATTGMNISSPSANHWNSTTSTRQRCWTATASSKS